MNRAMSENEARALIESFSQKQQGGHFACPRCGHMRMNAEGITCGTIQALEDMVDSITPLTTWAIVEHPENWRMGKDGGTICE